MEFEVRETVYRRYVIDKNEIEELLQDDLDYESKIPEDEEELIRLFIDEGGLDYISAEESEVEDTDLLSIIGDD